MLSDIIRSRPFSSFVIFSLVFCFLAQVAFSQLECPACKDFLDRPQAKVLVGVDQDAHQLQITVYYDNSSATPSRQPVANSTIIVELTNTSGLSYLYKTYTDANGDATFDFTQWDKACVNMKVLYCPFCDIPGGDCGFAQCIDYANIHNETGNYTDIPGAVTSPDDIPVWGTTTVPSPLNTALYFPDMTTVSYCAPPPIAFETPAICLPLIIIFSLLSGALYMTGRNPFASFNLSGSRVGKHIRYQARGRGFSMNVQSVATAASSAVKVVQGPGKDAKGKNISRLEAMKTEAKAVGGPLKAFGSVFVQGSRSSNALAMSAQAKALSKGGAKGSYAKALDTLSHPTSSVAKQGEAPGQSLVSRGGQQILMGSGGGVRVSDLMTGSKWSMVKAIALTIFAGSALGRIVDSYATIGGGRVMMDRFVDDKDRAAARAQNDKEVIALYNKQGGLSVALPNGKVGVLEPGSTKPDANGNVTIVYKVLPEDGPAIIGGKVTPETVTVTVSKETGAGGKPVLASADPVTIMVVTPEKLDSAGKVIKPGEAKEYQVFAKTDAKGNPSFYILQTEAGKPPVQVPVIVDKNNTLSVAGQPVEITKGMPTGVVAAFSTFGIKDGKMVNEEPVLKIASIVTTFSLSGSKEEIKVTTVPGAPVGQQTSIDVPKGQEPNAAMIKGYAEGVAIKTLGVDTLADKSNPVKLLVGQAAAFNDFSTVVDSFKTNSVLVQNAKADEWKDAEKKAWGELARDHPEALPAVRKAEQGISSDLLASVGAQYTPPADAKGKAVAASSSEALFDINQALNPSILGNSEKRAQAAEEISSGAKLTPSQGAVIAAAIENMVAPRSALEGTEVRPSIDDLKKMDSKAASAFMQEAVNAARKNGVIGDADASRLMSPDVIKNLATAVNVDAQSAGDILRMLPGSNITQVPVADLNSIRTQALINPDTGTVSVAAACERAGVPAPPSLVQMNSEKESLKAAILASDQVINATNSGTVTQGTMERLGIISGRHDDYMRAGFGEALPDMPKPAAAFLNAADAQRGQLARADTTMLESDPTGTQNIKEAFAKRMDGYGARYREALDPKDPEHADFAAATKVAFEAEQVSRAVGDNQAAASWDYLGAAPKSLLHDERDGKFEPTQNEKRDISQMDFPAAKKQQELDEIASENRAKAYKRSIYREDLNPKSDAMPSGADVAVRTEIRVDNMNANVAQMEEQAAIAAEDAAKKKPGKSGEKPEKKSEKS